MVGKVADVQDVSPLKLRPRPLGYLTSDQVLPHTA